MKKKSKELTLNECSICIARNEAILQKNKELLLTSNYDFFDPPINKCCRLVKKNDLKQDLGRLVGIT